MPRDIASHCLMHDEWFSGQVTDICHVSDCLTHVDGLAIYGQFDWNLIGSFSRELNDTVRAPGRLRDCSCVSRFG
ncbi:hypothetical protein BpHYR1_006806 [Brachionus plicatilis]|uniref:Uncharacterized protein n=1 Tax=Brachionus plicatilis TaxID=10195 RepID=A0A3M7P7L5_BRAPC|nr:hypothetical protein BpHYR1_006806 [Brachionus plicatilis]